MSTWARMNRLRRAALAVVGGGVALRVGFELNRLQRSQEAQVSAWQTAEPVFARHSSHSLACLMAYREHMLIVGPSGCGKTTAVLDAARASASAGGAVLLPFYVNLERVLAASSDVLPAADSASRQRSIVAAFGAEARAFESKLLRVLSDDFAAWAWIRLSKLLPDGLSPESLSTLRQIVSPLPPKQEESLYGLLSHLAQVGSQQAALRIYASGVLDSRPLVPVIIVDEVHVLSEPALEPVLRDLLRFVQEHVHAKRAAPVTIVLLSSDAYAAETVRTWGRVSRRLRTMRLGDLNDSELLPFLEFLAKTIASEDAATRFTALWETEEQLTAFRNRYGGYVSDIVALRNLHNNAAAAPGGAPQKVQDTSPVAALAAEECLISALDALSLQPHAVAAVFAAITASSLSPRGAVALDNLVASGVPLTAVYAMRAANLVELRQGNTVDGHEEYKELVPVGFPYVCAPCPLARESMTRITERLRAEGEKSRAQKPSGVA